MTDVLDGGYRAKLATLPTAVFYDCRDNENLTHDDPVEAVMEVLDFRHDPKRTCEDVIRGGGDVRVQAYARNEIEDAWFKRMAEDAIESVSESFDEEYMGDDDSCSDEVAAKANEIEAALRRVFAGVTVYRCHVVGEVYLSADDLIALVRDHATDWLKEKT